MRKNNNHRAAIFIINSYIDYLLKGGVHPKFNIQSFEIFTEAAKLKVLAFTVSEVGAQPKAHTCTAGQNQRELAIPFQCLHATRKLTSYTTKGSTKVAATSASVESTVTFSILDP